jgi:sugar phosphate isomerase/epimerase
VLGPTDLVLCSGTLLQASFADKVAAARAGGFSALTLWPHDYQRARQSGRRDADLRALLADAGLVVADLDPLLTWIPGAPAEGPGGLKFALEPEFYAIADALGARSLNLAHAFGEARELDSVAEAFAGVCDRAAAHGLLVTLEFLPWGAIADAATAWEVVQRAGRPNGSVMFDTWHHYRGGRGPQALRALPGRAIGSVQINDAPARASDDLPGESMQARLLPGEGDIPLVELIRALDAIGSRAPIGVEVFSTQLDALPPVEVGRRAGESARRILTQARGG